MFLGMQDFDFAQI